MGHKGISVLGSTGSIGTQALEVAAHHADTLSVLGLAAGRNIDLLSHQIRRFRPRLVSVADAPTAGQLRELVSEPVEILWGKEGLTEVARLSGVDIVVTAVVGAVGIEPTLAAIDAGKDVALANKETMVAAGAVVKRHAADSGSHIIPVDSEHSAIFQCLNGENAGTVERILLTASGGPFRATDKLDLKNVTPAQALKHPNWSMGSKITIDSATLMNKGLEVIEAHWLFDVDYSQITVVVHPESVVHSCVEFVDHSIVAQLGSADMRIPIQYALLYPQRRPGVGRPLSLFDVGSLHFETPDTSRFPALAYAFEAGELGGTMPCVLNAANEVAVARFLAGNIGFLDVPQLVRRVMDEHDFVAEPDLDDIVQADQWARAAAAAVAL